MEEVILKSGEIININNNKNNIIKKNVNEKDVWAYIIKTLIEAGKPLRQYEIAKLSKISKQTINNNISAMVSKGLILVYEDINNKYYCPQPFYLDDKLIDVLYGRILPFIKVLHENIDYSQLGIDNTEAIIENIQIILKLFQIDLDDMKYET